MIGKFHNLLKTETTFYTLNVCSTPSHMKNAMDRWKARVIVCQQRSAYFVSRLVGILCRYIYQAGQISYLKVHNEAKIIILILAP